MLKYYLVPSLDVEFELNVPGLHTLYVECTLYRQQLCNVIHFACRDGMGPAL